MFFKKLFDGLAETLDIKYKSHQRDGINSADIGELCEVFIKEFLKDSLNDHYKIYRGGNIVNSRGDRSPQLDIVITNRSSLNIFGDKGIYPIETVNSVFSITSNLTAPKLRKTICELGKIPKHNYYFNMRTFYGVDFHEKTHEVWKALIPFTCIFAFRGNSKASWLDIINEEVEKVKDHSLWPSLIIVNRVGMFEKIITKEKNGKITMHYSYTKLESNKNAGECFSQILFNLYNLSAEQNYMQPNYTEYFTKDY